jgi:hypothetical protein
LQQLLTAAAVLEQLKRRQALEITFLQSSPGNNSSGSAAAAAHVGAVAAAAGAAADGSKAAAAGGGSGGHADDDDDDEDEDGMPGAATGHAEAAGDGFESGYNKHTRQRIQQAPAAIAKQLGVSLPR